jgi:PAX-interacting protein 1
MQVDSMPSRDLKAAVSELNAMISCAETLAASAPGVGSRAAIGEDLAAKTRSFLQASGSFTQDSSNVLRKKRRCVDSVPLNMISSDGTLTNSLYTTHMDPSMYIVSDIKSPRIKVGSYLFNVLSHLSHS